MLTDYHTHTFRCGHAVGAMTEYVEAAIAAGIEEIGLSDHLYLYFLPEERRSRKWAMAESDYDVHYGEMLQLRDRYRGRANVRVGVEADYMPDHEHELRAILSGYEFDYVLGGVHFLEEWMIDDIDQADRYRSEKVSEIHRRYYATLTKGICSGMFDVIAHFDLPKKFGFLPDEDISDAIGQTLDAAREMGVTIEVSTAGLRKPIGEIYPSRSILREVHRRGIPIVLSSDAHSPAEVGFGFPQALALLRGVGFDSLALFSGRSRSIVPMNV